MPIRDVRICHSTNWAQQHWKAIQTNYGKSAYFSFYEEHIHEILFRNYTFLYDFNFESLQLLKQVLSLGFSLEATDKYVKHTEENIFDLRHSVGIHMRPNMVFPEYYQVFQSQGFLPDLSILDALFHLGPETRTYLMQCT